MYTNNRHFRLLLSAKYKDIGHRHFSYVLPNNSLLAEDQIREDLFRRTLCTDFGDILKVDVMTLTWGWFHSKIPNDNTVIRRNQIIVANDFRVS